MAQFADFTLAPSINKSLSKLQFERPTAIQSQAIPILLEGHDLIASAQTGSGKTAAFAIPMIQKLIENPKSKGLVVAPTRELAQQIEDVFRALTKFEDSFNIVCLVGGIDIRKQFRKLQSKHRVVVATPGRLLDHVNRNTIQIHKCEFVAVDEGDRMIDMGFAPQLREILKFLPAKRQTTFFTATIDAKVKALISKLTYKPKSVAVKGASRPVSSIDQQVISLTSGEKQDRLLDELNQREGSVLVFVKTKYQTANLQKYLEGYGFKVDQIHGDRTQGQRNKALSRFRSGQSHILCATDVAARGIDIPHVEHVINFDLPMSDEDYVHRIGRTARNGADGEALTFVTPDEHRSWNRLIKKYDIALEPLKVDRAIEKAASQKKSKKKLGKNRYSKNSKKAKTSFGSKTQSKSDSSSKPKSKSKLSKKGNRKFGSKKKSSRGSAQRGRSCARKSCSSKSARW